MDETTLRYGVVVLIVALMVLNGSGLTSAEILAFAGGVLIPTAHINKTINEAVKI